MVGAGAAGLAAAAELNRRGVEVIVLEARDRIGGRVLTARTADPPALELGAEFLHGEAPLTRQLARAAGLELAPLRAAQWEASDGCIVPARLWPQVQRVLDRLDAQREPDRSFAAFLASRDAADLGEEARVDALAFVEGFHAADPERVSERALAGIDADDAIEGARLPHGHDRLLRHLAAPFEGRIWRGHIVERIRWGRDGVSLYGRRDDGRFAIRARVVVVAVPASLLPGSEADTGSSEMLRFEPPVPGLELATGAVATGHAVRVGLRFDRPPRELFAARAARLTADEFFLHTPRRPFNVFWTTLPPGSHGFIGWAGGPRAALLPSDRQAMLHAALASLGQASGVESHVLLDRLCDFVWHDWLEDRFARGAYCYTVVGHEPPTAPRAGGRVFFAGEAFAGAEMGTVEGALRTGRQAADDVAVLLGSQV